MTRTHLTEGLKKTVLILSLLIATCLTCSCYEKNNNRADSDSVTDSSTASNPDTESDTATTAETSTATDTDTKDSDTVKINFIDISDPGYFPTLRGTFLKVTPEQETTDWAQIIKMMDLIMMETVIIQAENYYEENVEDLVGETILRTILDEAAANSMRVLIGLAMPHERKDFIENASDTAFMETLILNSIRSADRIWENFGNHPAFDGFYLSYEGWTPDENGLGLLGEYIGQVSAYCASKGDVNIAASFSILESLPNPEFTEQLIPTVLASSNVTLAILRDSLENRPQETFDISTHVVPYLTAFKSALDQTSIVFWGSADSFDANGEPPLVDRVIFKQIRIANEYCVSAISYEFATNWYIIHENEIAPDRLYQTIHATLLN